MVPTIVNGVEENDGAEPTKIKFDPLTLGNPSNRSKSGKGWWKMLISTYFCESFVNTTMLKHNLLGRKYTQLSPYTQCMQL